MALSGNLLSGTIPETLLGKSLRALFLDRNNFRGTIPDKWQQPLPQLLTLVVQNNSRMIGRLSSGKAAAWYLAICTTKVCYPSTPSVLYRSICVNDTVMELVGDNPSLLTTSVGVPPLCRVDGGGSTTTKSIVYAATTGVSIVGNQRVVVDWIDRSATSLLSASAYSTLLIAGSAADDVQMLSAVLTSPCACQDPEQGVSATTTASIMSSPFAPIGSAAGIILGNASLMFALVLAITLTLWWKYERCAKPTTSLKEGGVVNLTFSANTLPLRKLLRYPNLGCAVCMFLVAGITRSSTGIVSSPTASPWDIAVGAMGIVFVVAFLVGVDVVYYRRWVDRGEIMRRSSTNGRRLASGGSGALYYDAHRESRPHLHYTGGPRWLPCAVLDVVMPCGTWAPPEKKATVGALVAPFQAQHRHLWRLAPAANIVVHVLNAVVPGDEEPLRGNACDALQGLTILVCVATSGVVLWVVPHRATLLSVCAALQSALVGLVALLQLLCRGGHVGRVGVATAATVVSVVLGVVKLYHFMLPRLEKWWARHPSERRTAAQGGLERKKSTSEMVATRMGGLLALPSPHDVEAVPPLIYTSQRERLIQLLLLITRSRSS